MNDAFRRAGVIFDRAVSLLLEKVERNKLGKAARPRPQQVIRPGTDRDAAEGPLPPRDPQNAVKREVTVDNIALRCRRHNQYEADFVFRVPEGTCGFGQRRATTAERPLNT